MNGTLNRKVMIKQYNIYLDRETSFFRANSALTNPEACGR